METRTLMAYAVMLAMALTVAGIVFHLWYNTRDRKIARRRLREGRAHEQRRLERAAAEKQQF